jgi:hypothetical protein
MIMFAAGYKVPITASINQRDMAIFSTSFSSQQKGDRYCHMNLHRAYMKSLSLIEPVLVKIYEMPVVDLPACSGSVYATGT